MIKNYTSNKESGPEESKEIHVSCEQFDIYNWVKYGVSVKSTQTGIIITVGDHVNINGTYSIITQFYGSTTLPKKFAALQQSQCNSSLFVERHKYIHLWDIKISHIPNIQKIKVSKILK